MKRDDVLVAVNKVFGAYAWAFVGSWYVRVETDPPREIFFSADWVRAHVDSDVSTLSPEDLEESLRALSDSDWHLDRRTGHQFCLIR